MLCQISLAKLYVAWIDDIHAPEKLWLVNVISTLNPTNEIFNKNYVAPPIRKRPKDIETIVLPNEFLEGLPKFTSKNKFRRLNIISEELVTEKAIHLKDVRQTLDDQIVD